MNLLITGGAGFIGCNMADAFKSKADVTIIDNLSRRGTEDNLAWLRSRNPRLKFLHADTRNLNDLRKPSVREAFAAADAVFHFAGQVAVTTSVTNPSEDFQINALGTFNVIEALREFGQDNGRHAALVFSSTNKVYGGMESVGIHSVEHALGGFRSQRYEYDSLPHGVPETMNLDFHSPYGCTKGYADQYIRDIARPDIYDMKTVVFRQSCIYGTRQFGIEDQGWVAWFTIANLLGIHSTIYGDGRQTRDVLFISDLVRAYDLAVAHIDQTKGKIFNIGGGPANTISILELLHCLKELSGKETATAFAEWRPGDQKSFVSDIRLARETFGWEPQVGVTEGIQRLQQWVAEMVKTNPSCFDFLCK